MTDTCDLIYWSDTLNRYAINYDSPCYYNNETETPVGGQHTVETAYANLLPEYKEMQLDYIINNVYFLSTMKTDYQPKLQLLQLGLPDCRDAEGQSPTHLSSDVLETVQLIIDKMREKEVRILFRIGYHGVQYNLTLTENADKREKAYVSEAQMLMHIDDLAEFFNKEVNGKKNYEVINKMSSGFIGSGGEMVSSYQWPTFTSTNYNNVIKNIIEKICLPFDLYYTSRSQRFKNDFVAAYPQYAKIVGTNNDAVFGETTAYGHTSGCYQYNHNFETSKGEYRCFEAENGGTHVPNTWWEQVTATAAYTPQSGEMYHGLHKTYKDNESMIPTGLEVIKEMAHHRFVTLSQWNSYEAVDSYVDEEGIYHIGDSVIQRWINNETVTKELLDREGIIYDPSWFIDENGEEITNRNPYEFLRDHLGYKLVGQKFSVKGNLVAGSTVNANLTLKNYGFAAAFGLESSFVILDEDGNVVYKVLAGDPDSWISLPVDFYTKDPVAATQYVYEHTVNADIKLPTESGTYRIALLLENAMHDTARLSNAADDNFYYTGENKSNKNGYNVLMTFNVE